MSIKHDSKLLQIAPYFLIALALGAIYAPVITERYAWMDDYISTIWENEIPFSWQNRDTVGHGRPLHGLLVHWGFRTVSDIDDLWRLRALGLAMVILLCSLIFNSLKQEKLHPLGALSCALLIGFTPGAAIHAAWAQIFSYPMACALALVGGIIILPKIGSSLLHAWLRRICSVVMLLAALTIFQPGAGFYILPALARMWRKDIATREKTVAFIIAAFSFMAVSVVYLVAYKFSISTILADNPGVARGAISWDLFSKLNFAVTHLLPNTILFWTIFPESGIGLRTLTTLFMATGIAMAFIFRSNEFVVSGLACLIAIAFALSSVLLPEELKATFRTIIQFQAIIIFLAVQGWLHLAEYLKSPARGRLALSVIFVFVLFCGLGIRWALVEKFIRPQQFELHTLTQHIKENYTYMPRKIVFVRPLWYIPSITNGNVEEFGLTTTWVDFMPRKVLSIIFQEVLPNDFANKGRLFLRVEVVDDPADAQNKNLPIVDARELLSRQIQR